ncbi:hypothetical protein FHW03_003660 [Ochrobactrum sp. RH2CCR150]|nr:hypothetical protein [Ochrobactrum sp. RH2CCR150]
MLSIVAFFIILFGFYMKKIFFALLMSLLGVSFP